MFAAVLVGRCCTAAGAAVGAALVTASAAAAAVGAAIAFQALLSDGELGPRRVALWAQRLFEQSGTFSKIHFCLFLFYSSLAWLSLWLFFLIVLSFFLRFQLPPRLSVRSFLIDARKNA